MIWWTVKINIVCIKQLHKRWHYMQRNDTLMQKMNVQEVVGANTRNALGGKTTIKHIPTGLEETTWNLY